MKKLGKKCLLTVSFLVVVGTHSAHATLTCNLDRSVTDAQGTTSLKGTLTLDKIGNLASANFTDWNVKLTTPAGAATFISGSGDGSAVSFGRAATPISTASSLNINFPTGGGRAYAFYLSNNNQRYVIYDGYEYIMYDSNAVGGSIENTTPPNPLTLPCTCVTDANVICPPVSISAPVDAVFSRNAPAFTKEVPFE